jgi:hypothetical protein
MLKSLISRTAVLSLQRTSLIPELSLKNDSYKSQGLQANDGISVGPADQNSLSQEGACSRDNRRVGRHSAIGRPSRQSAIGHTVSRAATASHEAVTKLLLNHGAEVDSKDTAGRMPLSRPAAAGHKPVVKLLLE